MLQSHNFLDVLNLLILHDLVMTGFTNVEQLSTKREDTEVITTNNSQTSDGERLGGVSFRQDECAISGLLRPSIVSV